MLGAWQEELCEPRASCWRLCHFGSSAGDVLTWQGGKLKPAWGSSPSHGDWLAGADGYRQQGGGRTCSWWVSGVFVWGAGK